MTPLVTAAVLLAAVTHASWNAIAHRIRLGDFGQAYPIARGTAPLVVPVLAAVFVYEVANAWAAAGIAVSCTGLTGVAVGGMRGRRPNWAAIGAASASGVSIAAYTVVDGLGVRRLPAVLPARPRPTALRRPARVLRVADQIAPEVAGYSPPVVG